MTDITLYGIKNCDTVKKARRWLDDQGIDYRFHDVRADGLNADQVTAWLNELGPALVNKRSTRWKALDEQARATLSEDGTASDSAVEVILQNPTLIKRPVLDTGRERRVGFKPADYEAWLG